MEDEVTRRAKEKFGRLSSIGQMAASMMLANLRNARDAKKQLREMMKEGRDFRSLPPLIRLIMGTVATLPGEEALRYLDRVERECLEGLRSLGFTDEEIERLIELRR